MICRIRLATTEAGLTKGWLIYALKVPIPTLPIYSDHSTKVAIADGGQSLRGFSSFTLTWNVLSFDQRRTIRKLVEDSLDSGDGKIYATINRSWNGGGTGEDWIDVSGYPSVPDIVPVGGSRGRLSESVTLLVNNLTIVNDPASF